MILLWQYQGIESYQSALEVIVFSVCFVEGKIFNQVSTLQGSILILTLV